MQCSIAVGPFGFYYSNRNTPMNLPLHTHYVEVSMGFETKGRIGFPSFQNSHEQLRNVLRDLLSEPFDGKTNEDVCLLLFKAIQEWTLPKEDMRGGEFALEWLEFAVLGVRDDLGHAQGFTRYRVSV